MRNRRTSTNPETEISWQDYPRIEPGVYPVYCRWGRAYRDPGLRRWTCLLRFDVLSADLERVLACVPWWMNLGNLTKPNAGRRSRYFLEWIRANGGPPTRADRLSPRVFTRRMATAEIRDTNSAACYSVIQRIVSWDTGKLVTQSASHTVKGS